MEYLYIGIGIVVLIALFYSLHKNKKKQEPLPEPLDFSEPAKWSQEEITFLQNFNLFRHDADVKLVVKDNTMKRLSQARVKMWIKNKVLIQNLHHGFPYHAKPYFNRGYTKIYEDAQAGYTDEKILEKFILSSKHYPSLVDPGLTGIAITIRKNSQGRNRTCLLLSK